MFVEPTLFVLLLAEGASVAGSAGAAVAELGPGRGLALAPAAAVVPAGVAVPGVHLQLRLLGVELAAGRHLVPRPRRLQEVHQLVVDIHLLEAAWANTV